MADKVLCDKSDLVNIADAVRSKLGVTDTYYVSELSSAIQNIQTGGGSGSQTGVVNTSTSYTMIYTYFPDAVSVTVPTRVVTATSAAGELQT